MSTVLVLLDGIRVRQSASELTYGKLLCIFLSANLLVLALVMLQLLPTAELFLESRRRQPILPQEALHWSLKPVSLLNLFFLDKEIDLTTARGMHLFFGREAPFFVSYYLGAISVFGISLWFYFSSIREKITLLGLVAASLIVALGIYTPIYPFMFRHMPFFSAFRFPEKVFFFTYALLLYMALQGLGAMLLRDEANAKGPFVALAAVCVVWVGLDIFAKCNLDLLVRFMATQSGTPLSSPEHANMVAGALSNLDRQVALSLGILFLLGLVKTKAIRLPLFGVLIVSATFVDLAWAHRSLLFSLRPDFVYGSQRIMRVPDTDLNRLFYFWSGRNLHPSSITFQGRPTFNEAAALSFQALLPNAGVFYGFDYFQEIDALGRQPYTDFLFFANQLEFKSQLQLLRTFNVKYLSTFRSLTENGIHLVGHFPDYFSWLYEIEGTVPRAYVVNKIIVEKDPKRILRLLSRAGFDPMREVVLDNEMPIEARRPLEATVRIVRYENRVVTIETSANGEGILILADSYYPGWKALVDGREKGILRANLFFRAVPLPAGQHTVEFRYEPKSFMVGLAISSATLLALAVVVIFSCARVREPVDATADLA